MAGFLPVEVKPNIIVIAIDDAPTFMYSGWDSKHPFRGDGINPNSTSRDPSGTDIYIEHPTLDTLAATGVSFLNHYSQPFCGPDRAAIFSGMWAHESGVGSAPAGAWEFNTQPGYIGTTLAEAMNDLGYNTGICGKWHLSGTVDDGGTGWDHIPDVGKWDWYASTFGNFTAGEVPPGGPLIGDLEPIDGTWTSLGSNRYSRNQVAGHQFRYTDVMVFGGVEFEFSEDSAEDVVSHGQWHTDSGNTLTIYWDGAESVDRRGELAGGHYNYFRDKNGTVETIQTTYRNVTGIQAREVDNGDGTSKYSGDQVMADAEEFIGQATEPFFLTITPNIPHIPSYDLYPTPDSKINTARFRTGGSETVNDVTYATVFAAACEFHDTRLGEFFDAIPADVWGRTVVIWTSDNGAPNALMRELRDGGDPGGTNPVPAISLGLTMDFLINDPTDPFDENRMKNTPYEGAVRVPLVISGPAVAPSMRGTSVQTLSHSIDLYSTCVDLGGGTESVSGVSLLPVVKGTTSSVRDDLIIHKFRVNGFPGDHTQVNGAPDGSNFNDMGYTKILTTHDGLNGRYKLIRKYTGGGPASPEFDEELYWLEEPGGEVQVDPWEQTDLVGNGTYSAVLTEMQAGLDAILGA